MHIPDNYMSPKTCAAFAAAAIPVVCYAAKKVHYKVKEEKETIPLMAIASSLSFLIMMFNIPLPGGTTAHAVGGCLLAMLIGPYAACISLTVCLALQAFLFGDGGILALGINVFNMAIVMPFSGYFIFNLCKKVFKNKGENIGAFIGGYISINLAAFCAAVELGLQPLVAHDALNRPLYNPYPLSISIPAMMGAHLIIGAVEGIFTISVYRILKKASSHEVGLVKSENRGSMRKALYKIIALLVVLCPIGLLASGTAWGEWDTEELVNTLKVNNLPANVPQGMQKGFSFEALFGDYKIAHMPESIGYILSAVTAVIVFVLIYRVVFIKRRKNI